MPTLYQTKVTASGGRAGQIQSEDKILNLPVTPPKEMGGSGNHTNPEQLFAAGYAACFDGALNLVARTEKIAIKSETSVTVSLNKNENGFTLSAQIAVKIPDLDKATSEALVQKAHNICPYSKATKGNIDVSVEVL